MCRKHSHPHFCSVQFINVMGSNTVREFRQPASPKMKYGIRSYLSLITLYFIEEEFISMSRWAEANNWKKQLFHGLSARIALHITIIRWWQRIPSYHLSELQSLGIMCYSHETKMIIKKIKTETKKGITLKDKIKSQDPPSLPWWWVRQNY